MEVSIFLLVFFMFNGVYGDLQWCIVPSTIHVLQNETCQSLEKVTSKIFDVFAMQGEEESQQLLLDTRGWGQPQNMTNNVKISINGDGFVQVQGTGSNKGGDQPVVSWFQVGYVFCKPTTRYPGSGGGWRPDPLLVPRNGTVVLESEVTQPLWLSVKIPVDFASGVYNASIIATITGKTADASQVITIPVTLTVWPIKIPPLAESKFPAIFSFNWNAVNKVYGNKASEMGEKFEEMLISQRMGGNNLYTSVPTNLSEAKTLADAGVQWISLFDVYGASSSQITTGGSLNRETKVQGACLNFTQDLINKAIEILSPAVASAQQMKILDNLFVYGFDEAPEMCEESIRSLYTALKQKWADLRTVATVNWLPDTTIPIDVWVLQYEVFNADQANKWIQAGKQQWWYHCIEPSGIQYLNSFIERPQLQTRLLFWLASAHNISGWLYYSMVMWNRYPLSVKTMAQIDGTARTDFDPANYIWYPRTDIFANGDGNFLYPGDDGPIATVRLHNLRDGFEDAELFKQITDLSKVNDFTKPLVRSATDFTLDPLLLESQRNKAAQALYD